MLRLVVVDLRVWGITVKPRYKYAGYNRSISIHSSFPFILYTHIIF
jgi:hypothetical protein